MTEHNQYNENTTAWLSTTASQIFFMQLGFLCFEVGYVEPVWTQSIILKNIEDTFVGILTYLALGYSLSESPHSFYGIISIPTNPLLIGVDTHMHDQVLISAFFASTCATIISGGVLERMRNKAYILWCLLIVIVNYSFISHWAWHKDGWLSKLGFVDGAGAAVIHSTAGMAALIAIWRLGPRKGSINTDGSLVPIKHAARPFLHVTGAFFLWFGWFAFNVASPVVFSKNMNDAIGTTALVTVISPVCSSCGAFMMMHFGFVDLSFEHLLGCLLSGLVVISGTCHTINVWEAAIIGWIASILYFGVAYVVRYCWRLDDPLQVISIHLCCGIFSCLAEGIVANDTYGSPGLIYGGYRHFLVQILGVFAITLFNFIISIFLYDIVLKKIIFHNSDIRVSILDIYYGTRLFDQDYNMSLHEVLNCESDIGRRMLWQFHTYICDRYASEQLDFLIVVTIFKNYLSMQNCKQNKDEKDSEKIIKYMVQIINTYIEERGIQTVNVSGTKRSILLKIKKQLLFELNPDHCVDIVQGSEHGDISLQPQGNLTGYQTQSSSLNTFVKGMDMTKENIFEATFRSVWAIVLPHFGQFLRHSFILEKHKFNVKIPFKIEKNWILQWDELLVKETEIMQLKDTVPSPRNSDTLLRVLNTKVSKMNEFVQEIELQNKYQIIFKSEQNEKDNQHQTNCIVIE